MHVVLGEGVQKALKLVYSSRKCKNDEFLPKFDLEITFEWLCSNLEREDVVDEKITFVQMIN